jgi:hypothetical protein
MARWVYPADGGHVPRTRRARADGHLRPASSASSVDGRTPPIRKWSCDRTPSPAGDDAAVVQYGWLFRCRSTDPRVASTGARGRDIYDQRYRRALECAKSSRIVINGTCRSGDAGDLAVHKLWINSGPHSNIRRKFVLKCTEPCATPRNRRARGRTAGGNRSLNVRRLRGAFFDRPSIPW